jgi:hypothetical protein
MALPGLALASLFKMGTHDFADGKFAGAFPFGNPGPSQHLPAKMDGIITVGLHPIARNRRIL